MHEQICNYRKEYIYVCVKERSNIIVVSFPVCFMNCLNLLKQMLVKINLFFYIESLSFRLY